MSDQLVDLRYLYNRKPQSSLIFMISQLADLGNNAPECRNDWLIFITATELVDGPSRIATSSFGLLEHPCQRCN